VGRNTPLDHGVVQYDDDLMQDLAAAGDWTSFWSWLFRRSVFGADGRAANRLKVNLTSEMDVRDKQEEYEDEDEDEDEVSEDDSQSDG